MNYILYFVIFINFLYFTRPVISAHDSKGEKTFDFNRITHNIIVTPEKGRVVVGGSIQMKVEFPKYFRECTVTTPTKIKLVHNSTATHNVKISLNSSNTDQIEWLARECGFILSSVSKYSDGTWKFTVINENNEKCENKSELSVISPPGLETEISTGLGSRVSLNCEDVTMTKPFYCRIMNNNNHMVAESCQYVIHPITLNHFGNWTCKMAITGAMEEFNHVFMIRKNDDDFIRYTISKTDSMISLSCSLLDSKYPLRWCRAISPGGESFLLTEGVLTDRYSAVGTNLVKKKCGIEIKLPLNETDDGQWRLDFGENINEFTGCFISTSSLKKNKFKKIANDIDQINVFVGKSMIIDCNVPWPISYCYVREPNGKIVSSSGTKAVQIQRVGVCRIIVNNVTEEMNGRWTCGVSTFDGTADTVFYRDVLVISDRIVPENIHVQVAYGQNVILSCKSPIKEAMRYCRFVSPSGESFLIQPTMSSSSASRLINWGTLIKQGECTIQLKNVQIHDIGIWTCATSFSTIENEFYAEIKLEYQKPAVAFTIGMSIGGVLLFGLFIGILINVYRNRTMMNARIENRSPSVSSDEPLSSGMSTRMYNLSTPVHRRSIDVIN
ncbi:uncharacterized protein LOC143913287 [Arctopsyche grandis]|uniref:uncharacterized protein LOC143913287 n=1 Tax=Arctopsyche grandis TaxID=121162 RepID=UPI00406D8E90